MTNPLTVEQAREAVWLEIRSRVDERFDSGDRRTIDAAIDALIAAVRAECRAEVFREVQTRIEHVILPGDADEFADIFDYLATASERPAEGGHPDSVRLTATAVPMPRDVARIVDKLDAAMTAHQTQEGE